MKRNLKILIVDDSILVRKKLADQLKEQGCEVFEATNGREAVIMFLQFQPDGVFMDIVMPEISGVEALRAIREIDHNAHVIMLSSLGTSGKIVEVLKLGAVDFIQKPHSDKMIEQALNAIRKKVQPDD